MRNSIILILFIVPLLLSAQQKPIYILEDGKVVIGDTSEVATPNGYSLYVENGILTERVKVSLKSAEDWSDDSFDQIPSMLDVQNSISENKHLINMPSAIDLAKNGYSVTEMDAKLLEQIEWLWMHLIENQSDQDCGPEIEDMKGIFDAAYRFSGNTLRLKDKEKKFNVAAQIVVKRYQSYVGMEYDKLHKKAIQVAGNKALENSIKEFALGVVTGKY